MKRKDIFVVVVGVLILLFLVALWMWQILGNIMLNNNNIETDFVNIVATTIGIGTLIFLLLQVRAVRISTSEQILTSEKVTSEQISALQESTFIQLSYLQKARKIEMLFSEINKISEYTYDLMSTKRRTPLENISIDMKTHSLKSWEYDMENSRVTYKKSDDTVAYLQWNGISFYLKQWINSQQLETVKSNYEEADISYKQIHRTIASNITNLLIMLKNLAHEDENSYSLIAVKLSGYSSICYNFKVIGLIDDSIFETFLTLKSLALGGKRESLKLENTFAKEINDYIFQEDKVKGNDIKIDSKRVVIENQSNSYIEYTVSCKDMGFLRDNKNWSRIS